MMEKACPFSGEADALSGRRYILARETAADYIDAIESEGVDGVNFRDVPKDPRPGETASEHALRALIPLDAPGDLESRALEAEVESADPGE
jgi:hypothetical protein